ncbi:XRE family transcriptional regulator [Streptomyces sp. ISL-98]|uniref:XRE family transcriptional regulator n=1 Tax=Streptomyces sp. ISL-98 TaxID=2819192 RepID=UPI00203559B1|nr:XRE family transcriptional regulator [Streptomyces sp. ISL-98]
MTALVAVAAAIECAIEDILDIEDRRALPQNDLRILQHHAPEQHPAEPPQRAVREPEPESDRVLAAAAESARWAQWAEVTNVGDIALEQILADVQSLAAGYLTGDAVEVFLEVRKLRDKVFGLLEGHQPPRQSADLYVSAGYLCGLLAWISSDLGNLRAADTHGRTAWLCAENADHDGLRAWVSSTRSKVALWDGRLRDAVNHARRGAHSNATGSVGALLACQEADAWSMLGAKSEAQGALTRAEHARSVMVGTDEIGGLFSCPEARQVNYAAGVHLRIGHPHAALLETQSALHLLAAQPVWAYGTEAQIHISQAAALLACGEPDGVMEALVPVLTMPAERRMEPIAQRMMELARTLAQSPAADASVTSVARRTIEDWCLDSAARHLALSSGDGPA